MKKNRKRTKMTKFERLLYTFAIFLAALTPILIVFSQATLSKINYDVEEMKEQINEQQKKNESLTMEINELASLDKIQEIAKDQGLSYNSSNIKTIDGSD